MQITTRQYPHPVLSELTEDYKSGDFFTNIKQEAGSDKIMLNVEFILKCKVLEDLIKDKKASYAVHLECSATRYRNKFISYEKDLKIQLPGNSVKNKVEICIFVVAQKEIHNFKHKDFSKDFKGVSFQIEQGDILAFDYNRVLNIVKTGDNLKKVPSIFSITSLDENSKSSIAWEDVNDKILIKLSKENYDKYKLLVQNDKLEGILAMTIVIPVLIEILCDLRKEFDCYYDSSWNEVIMKRLKDLKIDTHEKLQAQNSVTELAYKVFDGLMEKCFIDLEELEMG
ncbi:hypothetical protein CGQ39_15440 [Clostridium botulinum]|uniref:hypothetical protein n=1 Tax=Clostridium botulinum TaxID=1491 RepID=UPI0021FE61B8|nr:hypothetical protein [Clostridium botulinum]QDY22287.1 hypothetical protein CGQ39_15440 [Clostridium botulinum]